MPASCPSRARLLGTIRENLDLLWAFDLPIVGEVRVPVRLALLGLPGERLETVERVYSIAAALAQADEFLRVAAVDDPDDVQHRRRRREAVAERGERGVRRGRVGPGRGDLRARGPRRRHPVRLGQPDPVRGHRAAGRGGGDP